jgi:hypothetical protein
VACDCVVPGTINAQQSEPPKQRAPSLTVDGPQVPRRQGGTPLSGVMNVGGAAEGWARYSLEDTGASLELPGEPQMLSVPVLDKMPGAVLKNYYYKGGEVLVLIGDPMTPRSMDAWSYAAGWMDGLVKQQGISDATIEPVRNFRARRVPIKVIGKLNGAQVELRGTIFFIDGQKEVLMVLAEFKQANAKARAVASRAVDSVEVPN